MKNSARRSLAAALLVVTPAMAAIAQGQPEKPYRITEQRAPCTEFDPLRRPHFGDMHVHTAWSFDASSQDTRNRPGDAYRFARCERMGIQPYDDDGRPTRHIQIDRPLDFVAVTDHSEFLGEMRLCTTPGQPGYWHPVCIAHRWFPQLSFGTFAAYGLANKNRWGFCGEDNAACLAAAEDTWRDIRAAAEEAYDHQRLEPAHLCRCGRTLRRSIDDSRGNG